MRVLIADDHTMVREGLRWAFENAGCTVVDEAADGEEAVQKAEEYHPDVVLMDLSLPVLSGVAATKRIKSSLPDTAVVVLSMLSDDTAVASALNAGARGYLVKDSATAEIVDAVTRVAHGDTVLSPSVAPPEALNVEGGAASDRVHGQAATATPLATPARTYAPRPHISRREEEVLRLMATGVSIPEAARRLYISVKTVKNHLSSIYQKLDAHDRAQAVLKAVRMGIIHLD
ncbi:MAG TPA: response regulator transcription factor [Acidimicrobiales bacterium]|nr:response regulator transcription factor [Acidimicrobiales bacterium]